MGQKESTPIDEFGNIIWRLDGVIHREDGPAIENTNGLGNEWWFNGVEYTEEEFPLVKLQDKLNSDLPENNLTKKRTKI